MVKRIILLKSAATALRRYRNVAPLIREKIDAYAADPESLANNVTELRGAALKRLRVGDFRVLFEETTIEIVITKIGPRGSIYD